MSVVVGLSHGRWRAWLPRVSPSARCESIRPTQALRHMLSAQPARVSALERLAVSVQSVLLATAGLSTSEPLAPYERGAAVVRRYVKAEKRYEVADIRCANARVDPRAMVVKPRHTAVARAAVFGPCGPARQGKQPRALSVRNDRVDAGDTHDCARSANRDHRAQHMSGHTYIARAATEGRSDRYRTSLHVEQVFSVYNTPSYT
jgi:hypothetical protein